MPYAFIRHPETRPLRLYYELRGEGPPLVLIRGFTRSLRFWGPLREQLEAKHRVLVFDNRGAGRSDAPLGSYTIRQMARDLDTLMEQLGLDRAHVFGMSMGGMIAQELALLYKNRVTRLILGATTPGGPHAARWPRSQVLSMARSATKPMEEATAGAAAMTLSQTFLQQHPEIIDTWIEHQRQDKPRKRGALGQATAVLRHNTWDRLPFLQAPTLVITGDADKLIPPANSNHLADRIPDAKLRIIKGAGHDFTTENPQASARQILNFLRRG